jgi:hypothetical protein
MAGDYHVYVHSPDDDAFLRATFTLELGPFAWADLASITPADGVVIAALDMAPGTGESPLTAVVELVWTQRPLVHEPVMTFTFTGASGTGYAAAIYDANVFSGGGGPEPAAGMTTEFVMIDCFYPFITLGAPSVVIVPVGSETTAFFTWSVVFWTMVGSDLAMSDDLGWLQSWSPSSVWGGTNCGDCFFDWEPGNFSVLIPEGTPPGTESTLTITAPQFDCGETTVILRATEPVPTERTTWGRIKSLYK